jgi:uncharacterized protein
VKHVVVLARAPSAKGKTRLTEGLTDSDARDLRERLFLDTLDGARATEFPVVVCFTPDDAREEMQRLAPDLVRLPQRGHDLGARMRDAIDQTLMSGADAVALIGSDLPSLPTTHITDAFTMLESSDLVLGPTDDGGFYLIGTCHPLPDVFRDVTWSCPNVCEVVAANALAASLTVGYAREWWDIDRPEDLRRLVRSADEAADELSCGSAVARRVREFLVRNGTP